MLLNKEKPAGNRKYYCILLLSFGLIILGAKAFAQAPPPQPPPPPGELFNKINPFKKNKKGKDSIKKKDTAKVAPAPAGPPGGPPPPPNPLNLFKKKKKDTTKTTSPSQKA
jgi:hypothetical protein